MYYDCMMKESSKQRRMSGETILVAVVLIFLTVSFLLILHTYESLRNLNTLLEKVESSWVETKELSLDNPEVDPESLAGVRESFFQVLSHPDLKKLDHYSPGLLELVDQIGFRYNEYLEKPGDTSPIYGTALFRIGLEVDGALLQLKRAVNALADKAFASFRLLLFILVFFTLFFLFIFFYRSLQLSRIRWREETRRTVTRQSLRMNEEERKKIARELHDGLAQEVALVHLKINQLSDEYPVLKSNVDLSVIHDLLSSSVQRIRTMARDLRIPDISDAGFAASVDNLCRDFQTRYNLMVQYSGIGSEIKIASGEKAVQLLRILHEGFVNIVRHSESKKAQLKIGHDGKRVRINLRDYGKGLHNETEGLGMKGVRERVGLLGGVVRWHSPDSESGGGTEMEVIIPINQLEEDDGVI